MYEKRVHWDRLENKQDRAVARLAHMAVMDTVFGGSRAAVIATKLDRMFPHASTSAEYIVGEVYSTSTGQAPEELEDAEWGLDDVA